MKKKHKNKKEKPLRKRGSFPEELLAVLEAGGLDTSRLVFCAEGDMDNEDCFCSCWLCFDEKGLYLAFGNTDIVESRRKKRPKTVYTLRELRSIPLSEAGELKVEKYVCTGRLVSSFEDGEESLTRFSIGRLADFDEFCTVFNAFVKGEDISTHLEQEGRGECPKCGRPYPDAKKVCPRCSGKSSTVKRLLSFFKGYGGRVALLTAAILVCTGITVYTPQISTRSLFDDVLANPQGLPYGEILKSLATLTLSILGVRLMSVIFRSLYQYLVGSIVPRFVFDIKLKIFSAMQRLSVGFYSSKQTGSLMERVVRDANNIYWFFVDGMPYMVVCAVTIVAVSAIMFSMSWKLSLVALCIAPFLVVALVIGDRLFRRLHHKAWLYGARVSSTVSDNINGQRVIKAFSKEDDEYERFGKTSRDLMGAELKLNRSEATVLPLFLIFVLGLSTVVMCVGGTMVVRGELTAGTLLSFLVYLTMLEEPFDFLTWVSNWWARCADSAQRVFEIVDAEPDITEKPDAAAFDSLSGDVDIAELDFEYEPARPIIKKLNLHVDAGEMLGIVGKTGAGKTTIANLIARLYDAKEGSVKIDGIDVKDLQLSQLRRNIGLVSQDIYLFIGTIADNIRYAKPDAEMSEVIEAAKAASAHDFIMKLPEAYETRVGAGGQDLSGGERQRISIARTIIQNPKILILDEATAAMDTETERNIQNSLSELKQGRTTIAIAHRLSTLRDADHLAVIEEGTIKEYGTYRELLENKGEFYRLYKIQTEALKTIGIGEN